MEEQDFKALETIIKRCYVRCSLNNVFTPLMLKKQLERFKNQFYIHRLFELRELLNPDLIGLEQVQEMIIKQIIDEIEKSKESELSSNLSNKLKEIFKAKKKNKYHLNYKEELKHPIDNLLHNIYLKILEKYKYSSGNNVIKLMLQLGLDKILKGKDNTWLSIRSLVEFGNLETISILNKAGMKLDAKDKTGNTMLHYLAPDYYLSKKDSICQCNFLHLLKEGANINKKNNNGDTPLHLLAKKDNLHKNVQILLKAGADINLENNKGKKPNIDLYWDEREWVEYNRHILQKKFIKIELLELLINSGLDINKKDDDDKTLIHYASIEGKTDYVFELFRLGVNIDVKDKKGKTPLQYAIENDHNDVVKVFMDNGVKLSTILKTSTAE